MSEHDQNQHGSDYEKGSLSLTGSIAMGTGVMIGAGIFALTGQVAELAGGLFPVAFIAEAARPAMGQWGEWLTIGLAIIATISGMIASMFAVSRMLAMLTDMELVPHRHFGMPGRIQKHTLVYTAVIALVLAVFFDLSRIASLGAIFYIVMDMVLHWGVFRHLRKDLGAHGSVLLTELMLDAVVLGAFLYMKLMNDPLVVGVSLGGMAVIFTAEWWFLRKESASDDSEH